MHLSLLSLLPLTLTLAHPLLTPLPSRALTVAHSSALYPRNTTAVALAGGVLNPSAAAEANPRDATATRAFSSTTIKTSDGQCLSIDAAAGDFRENLIPVQVKGCDGSEGEKFDVISKGVHNDQQGQMLLVSTVTQGCLNFDPRRKAGDQVILFSCGGRADGGGGVTNSQLFAFAAGKTSLPLTPQNSAGATCLVPDGGKLSSAGCSGDAGQVFTIG